MTEAVDALMRMLAPFAPHTGEELWEMLGRKGGLSATSWPAFDAEVAKADEIVVPVQINGKVRSRLTPWPPERPSPSSKRWRWPIRRSRHTQGKTVKKVVIAKGKLVSLVVQ